MKKYILLIKNIGLFTLSSFAAKLISFVFLPLYTYYLTTEEYAVIDLANVMQSLLWPVLSLSISEAMLRYALDQKYEKKKIISSSIAVIIPGLILLCVVFPWIKVGNALDLYKTECLIYFICVSLNTFFSVYSRAVDKVSLMVINSTISCFVIAILNIIFLTIFDMGLRGYFLALILGNAISVCSYLYFGKIQDVFAFKYIDKALCKEMICFSIPLIPNAIFWWINSSLDKIYITAMLTLSEVGLYSVASKIPTLLTTVTSIFQQAWSISAIKEYDSEQNEGFFSNVFNVYCFMVAICTVMLIALTKFFATILFSNEFYYAWSIVPVLIMAFYYSSLNIYYGSIFTAAKKTNVILYTTGLGALVNAILNYIMIVKFGLIGAAIATCISNAIVWFIRAVLTRKIIRLNSTILKEVVQQSIILVMIINVETINNYILSGVMVCMMLVVFRTSLKHVVDVVHDKIRKA